MKLFDSYNRAMPRRSCLRRILIASGLLVTGVAFTRVPRLLPLVLRDVGRPIIPAPRRPDVASWGSAGVFGTWVGHSTVLLRIDGFTILTDPVFSDRIGISFVGVALGVKRVVAPALTLEQLPRIDLVLLSHAHFDHFDRPSLAALATKATTVVTATSTSDLLDVEDYKHVHELAWDKSVQVGPVRVRAVETEHWGARMGSDRHRGHNAYVVESDRRRFVFAGDTAYSANFRGIPGPVDLIAVPIGCYNPWINSHCTPEQAWEMCEDAGAERIIPIHHQTFVLSKEPLGEPIARFKRAAGSESRRILTTSIGEEFHF